MSFYKLSLTAITFDFILRIVVVRLTVGQAQKRIGDVRTCKNRSKHGTKKVIPKKRSLNPTGKGMNMDINQQLINKKSLNVAGKLTWSALGLSAMLALSACSGDKGTEEPVVEETPAAETVEPVVEEAPVAEEAPVTEAAPAETAPAEETATAETEGAAATEVLAANAGEELYNAQCAACHATGLLNAPKFGDKEAWAPRVAKGIDTLHMHSAKGFNQMPAQAANGVSEAQVHAAVDYMVAASS